MEDRRVPVHRGPERLITGLLDSEKQLEDMIVAAPEILSRDWMLIGRQEKTSYGKIVDLLAVAPDGSLVLIELKRGQTPWEVVAQALDYASWVERLEAADIADIYRRFTTGRDLAEDFKDRSGMELDEDQLNQTHQIVIVAAELDDSTERIARYLSERGVPINILFFRVFKNGDEKLLSRAWLMDSDDAQPDVAGVGKVKAVSQQPWNGEYTCRTTARGQMRAGTDSSAAVVASGTAGLSSTSPRAIVSGSILPGRVTWASVGSRTSGSPNSKWTQTTAGGPCWTC